MSRLLQDNTRQLARRGARAAHPVALARSGVREVSWRRDAWAIDRALRQATGSSGRVLVGPWCSEVGFELLYWIPLLRRLLARYDIAPERIVAVSRGGAGAWYGDLADGYLDALDLVSPREYAARPGVGPDGEKQLVWTSFDREVVRRARSRLGVGLDAVVHPLVMYNRLRWYWRGGGPPEELSQRLTYRTIPGEATVKGIDSLPPGYVALKAYHSLCFPQTDGNRTFVAALVEALAERFPVVVLDSAPSLDPHHPDCALPESHHRAIAHLPGRIEPRDNLAVQTQVIRNAGAFYCTYGGFSYLGPLLGVPTTAFYSQASFNAAHLRLAHAAAGWLGAPPLKVYDASTVAPGALVGTGSANRAPT